MSAVVSACALSPPGGTAPSLARIWSRSARHALITAQVQDAVPIEPPAIIAGGSALSPMRRSIAAAGDAERFGRDGEQRGARAGADVGRGDRTW